MKKLKKDKLIEISIIGVLTIFAIAIGIKLYETTVLKNQDYHIKVITESDVLVENLELEDNVDIEKIAEENDLNITISTIEKVEFIETDEDTATIENNETNVVKDETDDGKTIVIVNEEKPVIPEIPTVTNEEDLTDDTKEPEYEEVLIVEENKEVEGDVVQVETKDEKDIPEGVNTTLVPDSENPFLDSTPPTELESGLQGETDAEEISDHIPGTGDKF
jgi:hypothetical protein